MMDRNQYVGFQDRDILEAIQPHVTPRVNTKELFVVGDEPIGRYRQFLKEWEARGWRIDVRQLIADEGRVAYAIPSPERRKSKGWVIDSVPLLAGARAQMQAEKDGMIHSLASPQPTSPIRIPSALAMPSP